MKTKLILLASLFSLAALACHSGPEQEGTTQEAAAVSTPAENGTVEAPASGKQELRFVLEDQTVSKGDTVCVEVTVRDFTQILSMQYTMNWDPKVLQFVRIGGYNLKDLSRNNFGLNRTLQGKIGTSWFDNAVQGISLPDGTAIYQVCFVAVGEPGSQVQVHFSSDPVLIEISNSKEELLNLAFKRATITIE